MVCQTLISYYKTVPIVEEGGEKLSEHRKFGKYF